ncbi:MAG TPA: primosomal protein N' [Papillibacter sp.]|nr:primosomal protein N' [Papillibacter sp.]
MSADKVARTAVSVATYHIDRPYDYKIPPELDGRVQPGMRVVIPFGQGNRRTEGLVLSVMEDTGQRVLKNIDTVVDDAPVLSPEMIKLAVWMSERFFCTVYDAAKAMLPSGLWLKDGAPRVSDKVVKIAALNIPAEEALLLAAQKRRRARQQARVLELLSQIGEASVKEISYFTGAGAASVKALADAGAVALYEQEIYRRPDITTLPPADPLILSPEQQRVFDALAPVLEEGRADAALLYGVTGSGKTAVYIQLIRKAIALKRRAIVLVPEIALTPQLITLFSAHFGERIAVFHSQLGIGERYDEWKRIRTGEVDVVVGTRSAVFAPIPDLGLVIIDEEQEHSYKSQNIPRYHTRDVAKYRCWQNKALLLLGSATPSLESMYSAETGKYKLLRLDSRYNARNLPNVIIADMKKELKSGNGGVIGSELLEALQENVARGEQSILFLNRRGGNTLITCPECAYTFSCPRCSVSLTYHFANRRIMCHYCGFSRWEPEECPDCGGRLKYVGAGTQKVEAELRELLPDVGILRMDADTVSARNTHEDILTKFRAEKVPILLGTQMVAKGLDFENVTLVGVLSADQMLYINDYRAQERAFSLITQVVGRSGRGSKTGRAIIQTMTPKSEVIRLAALQDYDAFYRRELELRRALGNPPLSDLISVTASGVSETEVLRGCTILRRLLEDYLRDEPDVCLLGPAPASVTKINNRYRYRITLSCQANKRIRMTVAHVIRTFAKDKACRNIAVYADSDPYEL